MLWMLSKQASTTTACVCHVQDRMWVYIIHICHKHSFIDAMTCMALQLQQLQDPC